MTRRDLVLQTLLPPFALLVFSCARPNAAVLRPLLNSERIERVFGSYGLEVLESDGQIRLSNLYSLDGGRHICRTFAMVLFPSRIDPLIAAEQAEIAAGGSIGAVFKKAGFTIEKRDRYFGELAADAHRERLRQLMGEAGRRALAVHVYTMWLQKDGRELEYATIAEVHHPDFLRLDDLARIYGSEEIGSHQRRDPAVAALLARLEAVTALAAPRSPA